MSIINWLTLRDYEGAKEAATIHIIAKQSRGSVAAQDGEIMDKKELTELSEKADESLRSLARAVARA